MSYKLRTFKQSGQQDVEQWNYRSLDGELESFKGRTIVRVFDRFLPDKGKRILEGGCGFGAWCEWFANAGHSIVGIEHDVNIVDKAKQFKKDVAVELGDVNALQFADNEFDAYISLGVIEHFERGPQKALEEAHRILRPDGLAFVSTPALTPVRRILSHPLRSLYFFTRRIRGKPNFFWEYRFTEEELRGYIENAGFEILSVDIDDYESGVSNRHIGLWADWFFLRKNGGEIWELNEAGKLVLRILRFILPGSWFCSATIMVAKATKGPSDSTVS